MNARAIINLKNKNAYRVQTNQQFFRTVKTKCQPSHTSFALFLFEYQKVVHCIYCEDGQICRPLVVLYATDTIHQNGIWICSPIVQSASTESEVWLHCWGWCSNNVWFTILSYNNNYGFSTFVIPKTEQK